MPGQSGNLSGRFITTATRNAEIARLSTALGRTPDAIELSLIRQLADLNLRRTSEDRARLASRICSQLGYSSQTTTMRFAADNGADDADPPVKSGRQMLGEVEP